MRPLRALPPLLAAALLLGGSLLALPAQAVQAPVAFTATSASTWQTNGVAWAAASSGGLVFVGGSFSAVRPPGAAVGTSEQARANLVVLDAASGTPTSCAPSITYPSNPGAAAVRSLAVSPDGRTLYVAGSFTTVNGVALQHLAALDIASCSLVGSFAPLPDGPLRTVVASSSAVYFGGTMSGVAGTARSSAAAVSAVGTATPGAVLPWAPSLGGETWTLALRPDGTAVVLGGNFTTLNGADSHALGVVDASSGRTVRTYPGQYIPAASTVKDLAVDNTGFYLGAEGNGPGVFDGRAALSWATYDERWRDSCLGATQAVAVYQGVLYSGSHAHDCSAMNEYPDGARHHLLAQSVDDPTLLSWFPDTDDGTNEHIGPRDLVVAGSGTTATMYVVGEFTSVNGVAQQGITHFATGPDATAPSVPLLSVTSSRAGEVHVAWRRGFDTDDSTLTYDVFRDDATTPLRTLTGSSTFWTQRQLSFTDTGLQPGTSHSYRVRVSDSVNSTSSSWRGVVVSGATSTYRGQVLADGASFLWRYDEPGDVFLADDSTNDASGQLLGGGTQGVAGAIAGDPSKAFTIGSGSTIYGIPRYPAPTAFTAETWFRTTTTAGGKIIGFGDKQTGSSAKYDRHVYMTADGRLVLGVDTGSGLATLATTSAYNDGAWHLVTGTQGASGTDLYVDGAAVGHDAATTGGAYSGFWRVGGDNLNGWPSAPSSGSWTGTLDETAVYPTALSASAVAQHYALGTGSATTPTPTPTPTATGSTFTPLDPRRLLDTRNGTGAPQAKVGPKGTVRLQVTGPAGSGLAPTGSTAVVLNVTATNPTVDAYISVYPTGYAGGPSSSNLNVTAGQTVPNLVTTKVAADGSVTLYNDQGTVDLVADLQGAYGPVSTGSTYRPADPRRVLDTRTGTGAPVARIGPKGTVRLQVTGAAGSGLAPTGSTAVVLNVTATGPTSASYVSVYPTGYAGGPSTSNLNVVAGQTVPNLVVSKVASDGSVTVYNDQGSVDVVVDLEGSFGTGGSAYGPLDPRRVLDTRTGTGAPVAKVGPRGTVRLQVTGAAGSGLAPTGSTAVVLNVTATGPTSASYVSVYPTGYAGGPSTSNLNVVAGQTVPNLVTTKVAADGSVTLYNDQGSVDLVADLEGSYLP